MNKTTFGEKLNLTQLKKVHTKKAILTFSKLDSVQEKVEKWLTGSITDNRTETEQGYKKNKDLRTSINVHLPHNNFCI